MIRTFYFLAFALATLSAACGEPFGLTQDASGTTSSASSSGTGAGAGSDAGAGATDAGCSKCACRKDCGEDGGPPLGAPECCSYDAGPDAPADAAEDAPMDAGVDAPADAATCHDLCAGGAPVDPSCDSCATSVCKAIPSCCTDAWTIACMAEARNICGGSKCDSDWSACAHSPCIVGAPLVGDANDACNIAAYCVCNNQGMPQCCTVAWDQACADVAVKDCGFVCT